MALSNCQVLTVTQSRVIGRIQVDTAAGTGNDYLTADHSLVGPAGPWINDFTSGGIAPAPPPFPIPDIINGLPAGTQVWVRWRQFDAADNLLDEEICSGFTAAATPTEEVCCGMIVQDDWIIVEIPNYDADNPGVIHLCYPPGVNDWTPLGN